MGKHRLKIVLMDENTEIIYAHEGMPGLKKAAKRGNAFFEVKTYDFDTAAERDAYLKGIEDMKYCSWVQASVLEKRHIRSADEIRKSLIGKIYTSYNSFNGLHRRFVIADVKKDGKVFKIFNQDKSIHDYIETEVMDILLEKDYHKKMFTIEGCCVFEEWRISPFSEI